MRALILGASGYNGGLVAKRLTEEGHWVRGLVRDPRRAPQGLAEVVVGDVATGHGLREALEGIDVAFYFVHSIDGPKQDPTDMAAAHNFSEVARQSGLQRGVFFTTLGVPDGVEPPRYQRNRRAVERVLLDALPDMTAVRAGMVLGRGSRGFRPYLQLAQRAPCIPMGPWRDHRIAVVDPATTTECLVLAGTAQYSLGRIVDVPASGEPTHAELFQAVAAAFGRRGRVIKLPWGSKTLDAFVTSLLTDDSFRFSRYLASVNQYDYVVDPDKAAPFASIAPMPMHEAIRAAVAPLSQGAAAG